jgi:hypothetical protein
VSDTRKFQRDYPGWDFRRDLESILLDIADGFRGRTS